MSLDKPVRLRHPLPVVKPLAAKSWWSFSLAAAASVLCCPGALGADDDSASPPNAESIETTPGASAETTNAKFVEGTRAASEETSPAASVGAAHSATEETPHPATDESFTPHGPHPWRTLAGMGAGLGILTLGYWSTFERQIEDWDDTTLAERLDGSAWRFDNNDVVLNFMLHPLAGAEMYAFARANHYSVLPSAGYSLLSSFLWEFVFEFREYVSVNDMIVTPLAGIPLGEFIHKLGLHLEQNRSSSWSSRLARWTVGLPLQLERSVEGSEVIHQPVELWHDFEASLGVHSTRSRLPNGRGRKTAGGSVWFRGRLISLPGFLTSSRSKFFHQADVTNLEGSIEGSNAGVGLTLDSDAIMAGWHWQRVSTAASPAARDHARTNRRPVGEALPSIYSSAAAPFHGRWAHSLIVGSSLGFRLVESRASGFLDRLGVVHLPGLAVDWDIVGQSPFGAPMATALSVRAGPDFAGAGSHAYQIWEENNPDELGKHILRNQSYFYGWGGSARANATARVGAFKLSGNVVFGRYRSQEGLNRWQERITVDVPARTDYLSYDARAQVTLPETAVSVGGSFSVRRWHTSVGGFRRRAHARTLGGQLDVDF